MRMLTKKAAAATPTPTTKTATMGDRLGGSSASLKGLDDYALVMQVQKCK